MASGSFGREASPLVLVFIFGGGGGISLGPDGLWGIIEYVLIRGSCPGEGCGPLKLAKRAAKSNVTLLVELVRLCRGGIAFP